MFKFQIILHFSMFLSQALNFKPKNVFLFIFLWLTLKIISFKLGLKWKVKIFGQ